MGSHRGGTFQEYLVIPELITAKKSSNISFDGAATLSVGTLTAACALYNKMKLPYPSQKVNFDKPEYLLIWGGSSSVGQYAVQLGTLSGFTVITTASPRNHEYLKQLGAKYVLDHSTDVTEEIVKITNGNLKYAFDTISADTAQKCANILSKTKSPVHLSVIAGKPKDISSNLTLHDVSIGSCTPEDQIFFHKVWEEVTPLLGANKYYPNQVHLIQKGLAGISEAFNLSSSGQMSAKKIVVRVNETL